MKKIGILLVMLLLLGSEVMADANEDARNEARTRISPVLIGIDANNSAPMCGFKAGETYTISWSVLGYDNDYNSTMVIFDCTDKAEYTCGESFGDDNKIVYVSRKQRSVKDTDTGWTYKSTVDDADIVEAIRFDFNATVTIPSDRTWTDDSNHGEWNTTAEGGNKIVVRFYQISDAATDEMKTISIIIGAKAKHSYGYYGRRVYNMLATDTDPDNDVCPMQ